MKVQVYRNLHRKCWSVRATEGARKGRVIEHSRSVLLVDCQFRISEVSRRRAIKQNQRNVHSVIEGTYFTARTTLADLSSYKYRLGYISYNPFRSDAFTLHRSPSFERDKLSIRLPPTAQLPSVLFEDEDDAICSVWTTRESAEVFNDSLYVLTKIIEKGSP